MEYMEILIQFLLKNTVDDYDGDDYVSSFNDGRGIIIFV